MRRTGTAVKQDTQVEPGRRNNLNSTLSVPRFSPPSDQSTSVAGRCADRSNNDAVVTGLMSLMWRSIVPPAAFTNVSSEGYCEGRGSSELENHHD